MPFRQGQAAFALQHKTGPIFQWDAQNISETRDKSLNQHDVK